MNLKPKQCEPHAIALLSMMTNVNVTVLPHNNLLHRGLTGAPQPMY